jgi:uncharacterized protein YlxW (UPF0749 family)
MNGGELMVVLIIAVVMIASIFKAKSKFQYGAEEGDDRSRSENDRLRGQVQQLQERIRVLERIVTDRGAETAAQIEALRDRDRIAEEDKA